MPSSTARPAAVPSAVSGTTPMPTAMISASMVRRSVMDRATPVCAADPVDGAAHLQIDAAATMKLGDCCPISSGATRARGYAASSRTVTLQSRRACCRRNFKPDEPGAYDSEAHTGSQLVRKASVSSMSRM